VEVLWAAGQSAFAEGYKTNSIIFAVTDSVRYSETFGDPQRRCIFSLAKLKKKGTL